MNNLEQLTIFQQNMALLPDFRLSNGEELYRGRERDKALARLITFLEHFRPDLVGLSEMWDLDQRREIGQAFANLYPHRLEGPGRAGDQSLDGGLLLLSRYPIPSHHTLVYQHCLGEDCLTQKGAIQARIYLPKPAPNLDLFLTHLQNPNPLFHLPSRGSGVSGRDKVQAQLEELNNFIIEIRDPRIPALLLGDLNSDGRIQGEYDPLLTRLGRPVDLWLECGSGGLEEDGSKITAVVMTAGLTFDRQNTFALSEEELKQWLAHNPRVIRYQEGERLDYFFSYRGEAGRLVYRNTRVVRLESSPGRDISDHYGLVTELAGWQPAEM
jgi:endonuclease/exonuclease/phosphatase family metal-dependent hydrolase